MTVHNAVGRDVCGSCKQVPAGSCIMAASCMGPGDLVRGASTRLASTGLSVAAAADPCDAARLGRRIADSGKAMSWESPVQLDSSKAVPAWHHKQA